MTDDKLQFSRRTFCAAASCAALAHLAPPSLFAAPAPRVDVARIDHDRILRAANRYLKERPVTLTDFTSDRSAGGRHDYFSEADYFWPDPANPGGPYINRDGMSNPDNFIAHRHALMQLSVQSAALAAAWLVTRDERYAARAVEHLRAWFVTADTRMNPNLQFAQAIHGRTTGRGTGIIDTLHLVEVARAAAVLERSRSFQSADRDAVRRWFADYLAWMTTSKNGTDERDTRNNHATCWVLQAAEFARYISNAEVTRFCRDRFKTVLVPGQIAADGSFPEELRRTKPYGYCLFNLDAMAGVCQALSTPEDNLWKFELPDGRGIRRAMAWMFPFIADKKKWPKPPDVMYDQYWPVRHPSLLFAGLAYNNEDYIALWRRLDPDPTVEEIIRNFFIRQPVLWV